MAECKHTPGPWRVAAPPDKVCTGYGDESDFTRNGWAKTIVTCKSAAWMGEGEEFANARLIAAAPELLDALKAAQLLLECAYPRPARNGQIARARAAIAKAEGPAHD